MKKSFADILGDVEVKNMKKREKKLPQWSGVDIDIPSSLALEQCSSSLAASHKAEYISAFYKDKKPLVCDLTGGLGVDSCSFSKIAARVHYYESNPELAEAVERNVSRLGIENMVFHCEEVDENTPLPHCDLIYADPARRDSAGKKVFKLEDCSPDIMQLLPKLRELSPRLLFKLSPMADLNVLSRSFGSDLAEIQIVSIEGEVKELLCHLERDRRDEHTISVVELAESGSEKFSFKSSEESSAELRLAEKIQSESYLLEPSAAILKSGAFKLICRRFGLRKLDISTHLYLSDNIEDIPKALFKAFKIKEILPLGKASFKEIKMRYPQAEVSAKNIPLKSEELRARLGVKSGSATHIFGCKSAPDGQILIISSVLLQ